MAEGIVKLMLFLARSVFVLLGGVAGYQLARLVLVQNWWPWKTFLMYSYHFLSGLSFLP